MTDKPSPATTKKRTPCQRCSRSEDGRCWQHPFVITSLVRGKDPFSEDAEVVAVGSGKPPTATFHSPVRVEPGPHWLIIKHYGGKTKREPIAQSMDLPENFFVTDVSIDMKVDV